VHAFESSWAGGLAASVLGTHAGLKEQMMAGSNSELVALYRQGAIATSDVSDPKKANKGAEQLRNCYRALRDSAEGRGCLVDLMDDPEPGVRCWAAAHCLQWQPDVARRVLERLRDSRGPFSFDAEMTLREYDLGRLRFDG
jgi:hypothetical protein